MGLFISSWPHTVQTIAPASLTINRCDLVIKQGDGKNHAHAFIFIYFFGARTSRLGGERESRAANMLGVVYLTIKTYTTMLKEGMSAAFRQAPTDTRMKSDAG